MYGLPLYKAPFVKAFCLYWRDFCFHKVLHKVRRSTVIGFLFLLIYEGITRVDEGLFTRFPGFIRVDEGFLTRFHGFSGYFNPFQGPRGSKTVFPISPPIC